MLDRMFLGQFEQQAYWIGVLTGSTLAYGQAVAVDSSGNVFVCGRSDVSSDSSIYLAKYNSSGVLQWQRKLGTSSNGNAVTVDSSGNVYVGGGDAGNMELAKYNTSGTIQWQVKLTPPFSGAAGILGLDTDSSNNVYICGAATIADSTTYSILTAKYNSSGTLQWQRRLYRSSAISGSGVAVDGSGNVYISGYDNVANLDGAMAKYDTNGTLQWQTGRNNALGDITTLNAVAVDSSANAYFCGFAADGLASEYGIYFPKVNTSGTAQFDKFLSSNAMAVFGTAIAVDGSDNVYVSGVALEPAAGKGIVAKYNSSGTLQWQRGLIAGTTDTIPSGVASDANGNVYLFGTLGSTAMFIAKLPGDGSLTGTYTVGSYSFTYSASSLTDGTISRDIPTALTGATPTLTASTTTLTEAAATLTSTVTTL